MDFPTFEPHSIPNAWGGALLSYLNKSNTMTIVRCKTCCIQKYVWFQLLEGLPQKSLFYFIPEGRAKAIQWESKRGSTQFGACIHLFQCSGTLGTWVKPCSSHGALGWTTGTKRTLMAVKAQWGWNTAVPLKKNLQSSMSKPTHSF